MTMPIKSTYDWDLLLEIKELLDNGYTNKQIRQHIKTNVSTTIISNVRKGLYGPMPKFKSNPVLKQKLSNLNIEVIRNRRCSTLQRTRETHKP